MKFGTKERKSGTLLGSPSFSHDLRSLEHHVESRTSRVHPLPSPFTSSSSAWNPCALIESVLHAQARLNIEADVLVCAKQES